MWTTGTKHVDGFHHRLGCVDFFSTPPPPPPRCLSSRSLGGPQACVCHRSHGVCVSWVCNIPTQGGHNHMDTTHTYTHCPSRGYRLRSEGKREAQRGYEGIRLYLWGAHTHARTHVHTHARTQQSKAWTLNTVGWYVETQKTILPPFKIIYFGAVLPPPTNYLHF